MTYEVFVLSGSAGGGTLPRSHPWDETLYVHEGELEVGTEGTFRRKLPQVVRSR